MKHKVISGKLIAQQTTAKCKHCGAFLLTSSKSRWFCRDKCATAYYKHWPVTWQYPLNRRGVGPIPAQ